MSDLLSFALDTARQAGRYLREQFGRPHQVGHKSSAIDLVTEADLGSERLILAAIRERFPGHQVLAEEGLGDRVTPGWAEAMPAPLWLVDPLDGTVNYAHGYPVWGVSLALYDAGRVVVAVTYDPLRDEMFWAARGQGAWQDSRRLRVSAVPRLGEALLATGFPYSRATEAENNLAEFNAMMPRVHGVRRAGAAVLDLAHVAAGRLDGYWERWLNPWDWAAGWLLVEEAGGVVTDLEGDSWSIGCRTMAASNGLFHGEMLDRLWAARKPTPAGRV